MLQPITKTTYPLAVSTIQYNTAYTSYERYINIVDLGDRIEVNGLQFSPDLTTTYGVRQDPACMMQMKRAPKMNGMNHMPTAALSLSWQTQALMQQMSGSPIKQYLFTNDGRRITYRAANSELQFNNGPVVYDAKSQQYMTGDSNASSYYVFLGAYQIEDEIHFVCGPADAAAYVLRYNANTLTYIGRYTIGGNTFVANSYWVGALMPTNDGVIACVQPMRQTYGGYFYGLTKSSVTALVSKSPTATVNYVRPFWVYDDIGKFYSIELAHGTNERLIRYFNAPSAASATNFSHVVCTGDMTPISGYTYPAGGSFSNEQDIRILGEKITINGTKYLLVVLYSWLKTPMSGYQPQSRLIAYRIDSTDATKLTLVSQLDVTRSCVALIDENTIYMGRPGSLDKFIFNGSSFVAVDTFAVNPEVIVKTEAGTVLTFDVGNQEACNITTGSQVVVNCRFGTTNVKITGAPIDVNLLLDVTDGAGVRIVRDVDLLAQGCKFKDGTTSKRVTTSATQTLTVPVTITSPGAVSVVPNLVV